MGDFNIYNSYTDDELRAIAAQPCGCSEDQGQCDACCAGIMLGYRMKIEEEQLRWAGWPEDQDVPF
jgi:hypothetical protein